MKCPECRAENPEDAEFCSLCYARFQPALRSPEAERAVMSLSERHRGAKLRCPNCAVLSPPDAGFCLKCGFIFEDPASLMVGEEEQERMRAEAREALRREEEGAVEAITVTEDMDGAEAMRRLQDHLRRGLKPRLRAKGRNAVTRAMKLVALLAADMRAAGGDLRLRVALASEAAVTHLDDLELDVLLENARGTIRFVSQAPSIYPTGEPAAYPT